MQLTCPACGAAFSLDVLLQHEEARAAVAAAMQVSAPLAALLMRYLALFRPATRQLTMDRVARLLGELLPHIQAARIERHGKVLPAPHESWKLALEQMLAQRENLRLPLKNHGYLYEVLAGMADRQEAASERKAEERLRYAPREPSAAPEQRTGDRQNGRGEMPGNVRDFLSNFGKPRESDDEQQHTDGA